MLRGPTRSFLSAVLLLLLALPALAQDTPVLRDLVIDGVTVFGRTEILRTLEIEIGAPLPADAPALAARLQERYRREGFTYARVAARFEPDDGRLTMAVDEGRIDAIEFVGVDAALADRLTAELGVGAGDVFNRRDVSRSLQHALALARGAVSLSNAAVASIDFTEPVDNLPYGLVDRAGRRVLVIGLEKERAELSFSLSTNSREDWYAPVDAFSPPLGFDLIVFDHDRFNHTFATGFVSYKFGRDEPGYALGFERPLFGGPRLYFGAELFDLTASDDMWRLSTLEQSLVALAFQHTYRDYYRRKGYQLNAALRLHPTQEVLFAWRDEDHHALSNTTDYSFFGDEDAFRENAAAAEGTLRSLLVGYALDTRGLEDEERSATYRRHQLEHAYGTGLGQAPGLRLEWTSEFASPDLGGDFEFTRHVVTARQYIRLSPRQDVSARAIGGFSSGTLPPQRAFALGGVGTVHGYPFKADRGDGMFLMNAEYRVALGRWLGNVDGLAFADLGRVTDRSSGGPHEWLRGAGVGLGISRNFRVEFGWRLDGAPDPLQVLVRLRPTF